MADNKDDIPGKKDTKPGLTTSNSLDKPLLDEETAEKAADIDTSHLTLDDSPTQAGDSLEQESEAEAPAINTSHLSLQDTASPPVSSEPDGDDNQAADPTKDLEPAERRPDGVSPDSSDQHDDLLINNPYVKPEPSKTETEKPEPSSEGTPDDDQVMLTSGISDDEFEEEITAKDADKPSIENDFEKEFNAEDTGAIKQLLDTVKKPETVVRSAWSNSSARRYLLDNVDSYRAKDEDQNMEDAIEKVYGGTIKGKFSPGKFLKENLLFSFLVTLLIFLIGWKGAGMLFPDLMPDIHDQIIETVQQSTTSKPKAGKKEEIKPIVTNVANKKIIEEKLSHCLIGADAKNEFLTAFSAVGYQHTNQKLTLAYEELSSSIGAWEGMNMNFLIEDAILRFRTLNNVSLPVIQDAHKTVADYNQSLLEIKTQAEELQNRIRDIKTASGNQSTGTINQRIPLRNELDKLKTRLAEEPDRERFAAILAKLTAVEKILSGEQIPEPINRDEFVQVGQEWLVDIADTDSKDIEQSIEEKVLPSIKVPSDKLKKVTPKLTAFHLTEIDIGLTDIMNLAALITYIPENKLKPYKLELTGLNRRINDLMENNLPVWIGYDQCLSQKRTEVLSRP